jgi:tripartite-type tricarboxylate transporter receptor subunit TctC
MPNAIKRRPTIQRCGIAVAITLTVVSATAIAAARDAAYPNRPLRLIVPYPPGAGTDFTAREVGAQFSKVLGQPVVIDNRPGGAATLGHNVAAKSAPDGYTLLLATTGGMVSGPALMGKKIPYDPLKDFEHVGLATYVPYSLVLAANVPAKDMRELIDLAKAQPGKLNFGSPGVGTPNHLGGAQLMTLTGIQMVHVPYKGGAPLVADLLGGQIQLGFQGLVQVLPLHRSGRLRIVGIGHPQRLKSVPDIPAIAETIPGFYNTGWWGIVAPAGTPKPIVEKLNAIMVKAIATPEMTQRFESNGLEIASSTPEGYRELIRNDLDMWKKLIRQAKISVDVLP